MKNHLSLSHKPKYNLALLAIIAGVLALSGLYIIFKSHAAATDADINGDHVVDVRDLAILAADFRKTGQTFAQGDLSGGGIVDLTDYSILAVNWGLTSGGGGTASCASYFAGQHASSSVQSSTFHCAANTGVPTAVLSSLQTATHSGTGACTGTASGTATAHCPAGVSYSGGYRIVSCGVTVDRWSFDDGITVTASNGTHAVGLNETATASAACVRITNSKITTPDCLTSCASNIGLDTGFTGSGAGPVYLADSEIFVGLIDGQPNPGACAECLRGVSYATDDTNLHMWRDYIHGGVQAVDSDGYTEVHDSFLVADRVNTKCNPNDLNQQGKGPGQDTCAHMDAIFQQNGPQGVNAGWLLIDHTTMSCAASGYTNSFGASTFCSADGGFFSYSAWPQNAVVKNNLFLPSDGNYCWYAGQNNTASTNNTYTDNVFTKGTNGKCGSSGVLANWDASRTGTKSCNNLYDDGTAVAALPDTSNCP